MARATRRWRDHTRMGSDCALPQPALQRALIRSHGIDMTRWKRRYLDTATSDRSGGQHTTGVRWWLVFMCWVMLGSCGWTLSLFGIFKARRARGRKASAHWLTHTARHLMKQSDPTAALSFKGAPAFYLADPTPFMTSPHRARARPYMCSEKKQHAAWSKGRKARGRRSGVVEGSGPLGPYRTLFFFNLYCCFLHGHMCGIKAGSYGFPQDPTSNAFVRFL